MAFYLRKKVMKEKQKEIKAQRSQHSYMYTTYRAEQKYELAGFKSRDPEYIKTESTELVF